MSEKQDLEADLGGNNYDRLNHGVKRVSSLVLDGYDQLTHDDDDDDDEKPPSYSSVSGFHDGGGPNVNRAYEETSVIRADDDLQPSLYFELERSTDAESLSYEDSYFVRSNHLSVPGVQDHAHLNTKAEASNGDSGLKHSPITNPAISLTYTDAASVRNSVDVIRSADDNDLLDDKGTTKGFTDDEKKRRQSMPIAAPRKLVPTDSRASQYEVAKPI